MWLLFCGSMGLESTVLVTVRLTAAAEVIKIKKAIRVRQAIGLGFIQTRIPHLVPLLSEAQISGHSPCNAADT